jgi:poly(3-hydroxybutyrate) depolymerase
MNYSSQEKHVFGTILLFIVFFLLSNPITFPILADSYFNANEKDKLNLVDDAKQIIVPQLEIINNRIILYASQSTSSSEEGFPVLFVLHGAAQYPFAWFFPLNLWSYQQSLFVKKALDAGFFVIAPSSGRPMKPGPHAWSSFIDDVNESEDLHLFQSLFGWLEKKEQMLNLDAVYCAGFSSGGFMTSRLAKTFPERFTGVLVHSGTDADSINFTKNGPEFDCESPKQYPINHPPTLIVHGEKDSIVPYECGFHFYSELKRNNVSVSLLTDPKEGHIWLSSFSAEMINWFTSIE